MLRATYRLIEKQKITVSGESVQECRDALDALLPEGFHVTHAPVEMDRRSTMMTMNATVERRDTIVESDHETIEQARAATPDGHQLLHVVRL